MLRFTNTLSGQKETFSPRRDKKVQMFVCGPTVYDLSHVGHARTYINFDAIVTYLRLIGYDVFYLQNITDIDDKIIKRAAENGKNPKDIAQDFQKEYFSDMQSLKVNSVSEYAPATKYINEIQSQVQKLLDKDYAYQIKNGVYFDIAKFKNYGKLSKRTAFQAEDAVSRIDESIEKKNKGDFCLWKISKPGEPKWPSPWGEGRPGWHIEDTAITEKFFSEQYDIHGGARDLIFPHHEAEIAQMESISEKSPLVKYWLHTGFLTINSQKMAKSLGNFVTIRDFLKNYTPEVLRFFIFSSHYRSPADYNENAIMQAKESLQRLYDFKEKIEQISDNINKNFLNTSLVQKLNIILEDDFNTPEFFSALFEIVKDTNKKLTDNSLLSTEASDIQHLLIFIQKVFKIFPEIKKQIPQKVLDLAEKREEYRKSQEWEKADQARKDIEEMGFVIEDTDTGHKIKAK
jgi:cysteinyl-tRNA synthetase